MTLSSRLYYTATALVLLGRTAAPQSGRAELFGTVRDRSGLGVPAATAELREDQTGARYQTITGPDGEYHFTALPAGAYTLTVRKPGFRPLVRSGITLAISSRSTLDLNLAIGDLETAIDVTDTAPVIDA